MRLASVLRVLGFLCLSLASRAQPSSVQVDLVMEEDTFLPGEELPVGVRISNLTGRPITLGTTNNWLRFYIETKRGQTVDRLGDVPVAGEFSLESSKAGTKWWNLQPYFQFEQTGPHLIYAELRVPELGLHLTSEPASITIQPSRKMWEMPFGVPPKDSNATSQVEIRRYALQAATRLKERRLYARVTDEAESRIFKVVLLDRLLSFASPEQQIDAQSRLHVLFQTGGNVYTYCVINPDGDLAIRQQHKIAPGTRPRLVKEDNGDIAVRGGFRVPTSTDVPPYEEPASPEPKPAASSGGGTNGVAISSSTSTNAPAEKSDRKSRRREKRSSP